jgi:hypothetical protein
LWRVVTTSTPTRYSSGEGDVLQGGRARVRRAGSAGSDGIGQRPVLGSITDLDDFAILKRPPPDENPLEAFYVAAPLGGNFADSSNLRTAASCCSTPSAESLPAVRDFSTAGADTARISTQTPDYIIGYARRFCPAPLMAGLWALVVPDSAQTRRLRLHGPPFRSFPPSPRDRSAAARKYIGNRCKTVFTAFRPHRINCLSQAPGRVLGT